MGVCEGTIWPIGRVRNGDETRNYNKTKMGLGCDWVGDKVARSWVCSHATIAVTAAVFVNREA